MCDSVDKPCITEIADDYPDIEYRYYSKGKRDTDVERFEVSLTDEAYTALTDEAKQDSRILTIARSVTSPYAVGFVLFKTVDPPETLEANVAIPYPALPKVIEHLTLLYNNAEKYWDEHGDEHPEQWQHIDEV